jgi:hypothetical protein
MEPFFPPFGDYTFSPTTLLVVFEIGNINGIIGIMLKSRYAY